MSQRTTIVGNYEIFYWKKQTPTGVSGWIVRKQGATSPSSKHYSKREALVAAKRFNDIDTGKAEVVTWNGR